MRNLFPSIQNTRLFHPLRNAYLWTAKRSYWKEHVLGPRLFFRQFVPVGSTVFDIGANVGELTQAFLALGASRVVAVEPTPHLVAELKRIRDRRLTVVSAAAGRERGHLPFNVSNFSNVSSFSAKWLDNVAHDVPGGPPKWIEQIQVEVMTLDDLIRTHGMPDYIKIDVEGYEIEVLQGLTKAPRFLSFEFTARFPDVTVSCLRQKCFPPYARFNYLLDDVSRQSALALAEWCDVEEMIRIVKTVLTHDQTKHGDIFVRS